MAAEDHKVGFEATTSSIKDMFTTLNATYDGKRDRKALIIASDRGFRVSVANQERSMYAVAYLDSGMFSKFVCAPAAGAADVRLKVSLHALLQCMTVFGSGVKLESTMMRFAYSDETALVTLHLHENRCTTECEIATFDVTEEDDDEASLSIGEQFRPEVTVAQVSVQADVLRECFQEILGIAGAAGVTLTVSNRVPYFRLSTAGTSGSCSVDLPRGSDAVMAHSVTPHGDSESEALTVDPAAEHSVSSEFLAPLVEQAIRPLSSSTTAFIRLNRDGVLSINHRIAVECQPDVYVSVVVLPVTYEEEDGEEEEAAKASGAVSASPERSRSLASRDTSVTRANQAAALDTMSMMREVQQRDIARARIDAAAERDADILRMASAANERVYGRGFSPSDQSAEGGGKEDDPRRGRRETPSTEAAGASSSRPGSGRARGPYVARSEGAARSGAAAAAESAAVPRASQQSDGLEYRVAESRRLERRGTGRGTRPRVQGKGQSGRRGPRSMVHDAGLDDDGDDASD